MKTSCTIQIPSYFHLLGPICPIYSSLGYLTPNSSNGPVEMPSEDDLETFLHLISYSDCQTVLSIVLQKLINLIQKHGDSARAMLTAGGSLNAIMLLFSKCKTPNLFSKIVELFNCSAIQVESLEPFQINHLAVTLASAWTKIPDGSISHLLTISNALCLNGMLRLTQGIFVMSS